MSTFSPALHAVSRRLRSSANVSARCGSRLGDELVGLLDRRSRLVDEGHLHLVPATLEARALLGIEQRLVGLGRGAAVGVWSSVRRRSRAAAACGASDGPVGIAERTAHRRAVRVLELRPRGSARSRRPEWPGGHRSGPRWKVSRPWSGLLQCVVLVVSTTSRSSKSDRKCTIAWRRSSVLASPASLRSEMSWAAR